MYREQIDAYIDSKKDEMLQDVMALVRIDSQKGVAQPGMPFGEGPAKVLEKAEAMMTSYGLRTKNYDNYVVCGDFGPGEKELDILAHLDVVPVTEDWTVTQPFQPLIKDGRIYGRGTADDKGPAIAALYAIRAVKDLGLPLKRGVRLILGSDEECGSSDLLHYYQIEKEAPCTFTPDADFPVINLEKGHLAKTFQADYLPAEGLPKILSLKGGNKVNVVPAKAEAVLIGVKEQQLASACEQAEKDTRVTFQWKKEGEQFKISASGIAAHASIPETGNNAVTALLYLVSLLPLTPCAGHEKLWALNRMFRHGDTCGEALQVKMGDEVSGNLTMNLGILNYEENHLSGEYDSRAPLCANDENLTEVMRKAFADAGMEMGEGNMTPPHYVPADSAFVSTLLESYEKYTGQKGEALSTGGGTYVHNLERGVAFGCMMEGVDNHMHGDDEFMEIDTLLMSAKIFADVIMKLCN